MATCAGGPHLQQVALGLVLVGDAEVLLLVPVTLPPGAQAARTSATDGHASSHKTAGNEDHIGFQSCRSLCSHLVNRHSFQKYVTH